MMSACSAFYNDTTQTYPQDNPYTATIFLQIQNLPIGSDAATELAKWKSATLTLNATFGENQPHITDITYTSATADVYQADLTISNVPDSTLTKTVRPFQIIYTQTIYNPLALLPNSTVFEYNILFSSERRHSSATTLETNFADNEYVYYWTDATPIQFTDVYPNRPLYCVLIILGAAVIGVIVFLVSRYIDCKKHKNQL